MIKKLKSKDGIGMIPSIIIIIVVMIVFCLVAEHARQHMIVKGIRDAIETASTSVMTQNYDEAYPCLREGYSAGYKLNETSNEWDENIDSGDIEEHLIKLLGLKREEGGLVKKKGSKLEFKISNINVKILNRELTPKDVSKAEKFKIEVKSKVTVPVAFGFDEVNPLNINLKVVSGYTPKF